VYTATILIHVFVALLTPLTLYKSIEQ